MDPTTPAAGWYADPTTPGTARWWDGTQWTEHTTPLTPPEPAARPETGAHAAQAPSSASPMSEAGPEHAAAPAVGAGDTFLPEEGFEPEPLGPVGHAPDLVPTGQDPSVAKQPALAPGTPSAVVEPWQTQEPTAPWGASIWDPSSASLPAPTPVRKGVPRAVTLGIVVGLLAVLIGGGLLAFAKLGSLADGTTDDGAGSGVPGYGDQVDKASDTAASADVQTIATQVEAYFTEYPSGSVPHLSVVGGNYVLTDSTTTWEVGPVSDGVTPGGVTGSGLSDFCVWVTSASGTSFHAGLATAATQGACQG
ncbi:DUF2510 domain-containing protein [Demequina capsici]|uniref:DUF2510 domain-containing protein n=1 Tax=Demequina capsici TaxID=3075620 RepID=A0AA96FAH0_9MICO|nr:DUF2510 domain-containing protein [Demequina sp. PMTSA13]WNM26347.1 DUF2510 domain-containing protein [Demequina sp. PMTSA13]